MKRMRAAANDRLFRQQCSCLYTRRGRCAATDRDAAFGYGGFLSIQVLNEFANVAHRKLMMGWPEVATALSAIRSLVTVPVAITLDLHVRALELAERHKFALYDALIVAAALSVGSDVLYSEDMSDGMLVDGSLTIVNPFKGIV